MFILMIENKALNESYISHIFNEGGCVYVFHQIQQYALVGPGLGLGSFCLNLMGSSAIVI